MQNHTWSTTDRRRAVAALRVLTHPVTKAWHQRATGATGISAVFERLFPVEGKDAGVHGNGGDRRPPRRIQGLSCWEQICEPERSSSSRPSWSRKIMQPRKEACGRRYIPILPSPGGRACLVLPWLNTAHTSPLRESLRPLRRARVPTSYLCALMPAALPERHARLASCRHWALPPRSQTWFVLARCVLTARINRKLRARPSAPPPLGASRAGR